MFLKYFSLFVDEFSNNDDWRSDLEKTIFARKADENKKT